MAIGGTLDPLYVIPENCLVHHCICSVKAFLDRITLQLKLPGFFQNPLYVCVLFPTILCDLGDALNIGSSRCQFGLIVKIC